jgi:hypothetical protein
VTGHHMIRGDRPVRGVKELRKANAGLVFRKPLVRAGGVIREALDNTWRTPERFLERVRVYFGGPIPFDPATGRENPTRALRICTEPPTPERLAELVRATARGADLSLGLYEGELAIPLVSARITNAALLALKGEHPSLRSGLDVAWDWPTWCNPPYGRELKVWLTKFVAEARRGTEIVAFLPCARWEQGYFQRALRAARNVCFVKGRVAFISSIDGVAVGGNPYASMLVGWNTDGARWLEAFEPVGSCLDMKPTRRRARRAAVLAERAQALEPSLFDLEPRGVIDAA